MFDDDSRHATAFSLRRGIASAFAFILLACCGCGFVLCGLPQGAAAEIRDNASGPTGAELDLVFSDFENYTEKSMKEWHVPGIAVGVVRGGEIVYLHGFGNRSQDAPLPVTPNTVFQIGSASKAFTAALVAMLVDEGKLRWTDRVVDHLPDFQLYDPWVTREFTVKDLLDHSSGLPDHAAEDLITLGYDRETVMRSLKKIEPTCSFRSGYNYSNSMLLWAAYLVEAKSGRTWEENLHDRIFVPLQMNNSSSDMESFLKAGDVAALHKLKDYRLQNATLQTMPMNWTYMDWIYIAGPAGGINSNVIDMAKWLRLQMSADNAYLADHTVGGLVGAINKSSENNTVELISREGLRYMHSPQNIMDRDGKLYYGLGWIYEEHEPHSIVWHNGGSFGHHSMIAFIPEDDIGIVILSNSGSSIPECLAYWFFDRYFGLPQKDYSNISLAQSLMLENLTGSYELKRPEPFQPPLPLQSYAGNYTSDIYGPINITVSARQDHLLAMMGPRPLKNILYPWSREMFFTQEPEFLNSTGFAAFRLDPTGKPESVLMSLFIEGQYWRKAEFWRVG